VHFSWGFERLLWVWDERLEAFSDGVIVLLTRSWYLNWSFRKLINRVQPGICLNQLHHLLPYFYFSYILAIPWSGFIGLSRRRNDGQERRMGRFALVKFLFLLIQPYTFATYIVGSKPVPPHLRCHLWISDVTTSSFVTIQHYSTRKGWAGLGWVGSVVVPLNPKTRYYFHNHYLSAIPLWHVECIFAYCCFILPP